MGAFYTVCCALKKILFEINLLWWVYSIWSHDLGWYSRSTKLYSPCLHPYLSFPKHLTDPCCLGLHCASLSVALCVRLHICLHIRDVCVHLCVLHVHAYVNPQVCLSNCLCLCMSVMSAWAAPRDHSGRSALGTHIHTNTLASLKRCTASVLHDCRVPMHSSIHP